MIRSRLSFPSRYRGGGGVPIVSSRLSFFFFLSFLPLLCAPAFAESPWPDGQDLPFSLRQGERHLFRPPGTPRGVVVLFSDASGWGAADTALAMRWQNQGALVMGLDSPALLRQIASTTPGECADLSHDLESFSQDLQRRLALDPYQSPILAGTGVGGALALATLAGADVNTYATVIVADPAPVVPSAAPLCKLRPNAETPPSPPLPWGFTTLEQSVRIILTPTAPVATRRQVRGLSHSLPSLWTVRAHRPATETLARRVSRVLASTAPGTDAALVPLPAPPRHDLMAIVISGDGGWRDLDRDIALRLQKEGIPTVGIDSLRTFWSRKTPQTTAALLSKVMATYTTAWGVDRVLLIGYSFGADLLPTTYAALSEADRSRVIRLSLLALSTVGDYEISLTGWMGGTPPQGLPTLPALEGIAPSLLQCAYGEEETDGSACPALASRGVDVLRTPGGHHFDGNYDRIASWILSGIAD